VAMAGIIAGHREADPARGSVRLLDQWGNLSAAQVGHVR
jgi:hypothetical protein